MRNPGTGPNQGCFRSARRVLGFVVLLLALLLAAQPQARAQLMPGLGGGDEAEAPPEAIPENLKPEEVDGVVARMTDAQVRDSLIDTLTEKARRDSPRARSGAGGLGVFLARARLGLEGFTRRLTGYAVTLGKGYDTLVPELGTALGKLRGGRSVGAMLGHILAALAAAGLLFWGATLKLRPTRRRIEAAGLGSSLRRLLSLATRFGVDLLPVLAFLIAVVVLASVAYDGDDPLRRLVLLFGTGAAFVLTIDALSRLVLAPRVSELRLLPVGDEIAALTCRSLLILLAVSAFIWLAAGALILSGMKLPAHLLLVSISGTAVMALVVILSFSFRRPLAEAIKGDGQTAWRAFAARHWHSAFLLYAFIVWILWTHSMLARAPSALWPAVASLLIVAAVPILDRRLGRLAVRVFNLPDAEERTAAALTQLERAQDQAAAQRRELGIAEESDPEPTEAERQASNDAAVAAKSLKARRSYAVVARQAIRVALVGLGAILLLQTWNIGLPGMSGEEARLQVWSALLDAGITVLIGYAFWRLTASLIDPHMPEAREASADEGGGAALTRLETLLPLLRVTLLVLIVLVTTVFTLSSLGVDIAPLIAGAGVVGLAVGFGAQALVRDIVSGIFFLIDDAFRVGEYIEFGELRGEVEAISLRSLKLRHHKGPVHTVPFGELRSVTNHNRDWTIYKMEFRLPFETDVQQVKKIVKRIGAEMLADPEFGPKMIQPMKSQGITRVDDDAIILRTKFMCKPREQFVLRRFAYQRIKEEFRKVGIEFAPRQVRVRTGTDKPEEAAAAGHSAAVDPNRPETAGDFST